MILPSFVLSSLTDKKPIEAYKARDLLLIYDNDLIVKGIQPNYNTLLEYDSYIIISAKSSISTFDFISRFFSVSQGMREYPVTGSSYCTSAPYWQEKLGRNKLKAFQASKRGGELFLEVMDNKVFISGTAVTVIEGKIIL